MGWRSLTRASVLKNVDFSRGTNFAIHDTHLCVASHRWVILSILYYTTILFILSYQKPKMRQHPNPGPLRRPIILSLAWVVGGEVDMVDKTTCCRAEEGPRIVAGLVWGTSANGGMRTTSGVWKDVRTRDIHPISVHCWASVADGGPVLYRHWVNVSCLLNSNLDTLSQWWSSAGSPPRLVGIGLYKAALWISLFI